MCGVCVQALSLNRRGLLRGAAGFAAVAAMRPRLLAAQTTAEASPLPSRREVLVKQAYVISMDDKIGEAPNMDVHVRNGAIVAVGPRLQADGAEVIDGRDMIALPGLIDTHWHMWGTVARNTAGDAPNMGYFSFAKIVGSIFDAEDNARGVRLGIAEAINSGLTTVHNWSHNLVTPGFADAELQAHRSMGHRALFGYGYFGIGMRDQTVRVEDLARVNERWIQDSEGLLTLGVCSRGPENNSVELCRGEWEAARKMGLRISTHMGTNRKRVLQRQGVKTLEKAGLLGSDVILVHQTNTVDDDCEVLARTGTHVSLSPFTEMRTGFGFPPMAELEKAGVPLSLSVDTGVLAGDCDMFAIMKAIHNVANGEAKSEFAMPIRRVLEMATMGGAKALGIADRVGSLTPGKRADMILVRTTDLNMAPLTDPAHMVVQSANPSNVDTVMIDGRILKRHGQLVGIDVRKIVADANDTAKRVRAAAAAR